jgi:hypothetical protein
MNDKKFSILIRELIRATGKSIGTISYDARLKEAAIRKFLNGHAGLNTRSLDRIIAAVFPNGVFVTPVQSVQPATLPGGQE